MKLRVGSDAGVELARGNVDLAVAAVDHVSIVVHGRKVVVRSDFLELSEGLFEQVTLPQAHVIDRRRVGSNVRHRELDVALEIAGRDAVEPPSAAGRRNMPLDIRPLTRELVRCDDELLLDRRRQNSEDEPDGDVANQREEREPDELPAQHAVDHERRGEQPSDSRETNATEQHVHVGVARADQRTGRRIQQRRGVDEPQLDTEQHEQERQQYAEMPRRPCFDRDASRPEGDVSPRRVE